MSKHPGSYYSGQPPIGPGQAPAIPGQPYDPYSWTQQYYQASSAAAAAAATQPAAHNPYANYGYGPAATWAHHPPPTHPRAVPPAGPVPHPPQAPHYGPYLPQTASSQPYPPHAVPSPYPARPMQPPPPPPPTGQPLPVAPRQFQQPPLKRQRVYSLPSGGSRPPVSGQPPRPPTESPAPLPPPQLSSNSRSGNGIMNSGPSSRGRGGQLRPSRGGRGGLAGRNMGTSSHSSSGLIPRGPRRGGYSQSNARPMRAMRNTDGQHSSKSWVSAPSEGSNNAASGATGSQFTDKEGKRTLTDFRIVGFGFVSDSTVWSWGVTRPIDDKNIFPKLETTADGQVATSSTEKAPVQQGASKDSNEQSKGSKEKEKEKGKKSGKDAARVRIYFQPAVPPSRSGRQSMAPPSGLPSRPNAKRKKADSEEDDVERKNIKRHHGDSDDTPRSSAMATDLPSSSQNDPEGSPNASLSSNTLVPQGDIEEKSEVSNEGQWMGDVLKEEEEEVKVLNYGDETVKEEHDADQDDHIEYIDELDEAEEDGASLFGSGAYASPHHGEDGDGDLVVQHVDESSQDLEAGHASESFTAPGADGETKAMNGEGSQTLAGHSTGAGGPGGAGDKLSISFSSSRKRLVFEADVVSYLKVFRAEGRIEFASKLEVVPSDDDNSEHAIKGVTMDVWHEAEQAFHSVPIPTPAKAEDDIPPLSGSIQATFHVFLDQENPLSMPKWVKNGDVDTWLATMFGFGRGSDGLRRDENGAGASKGWEGKIHVVDPDPALTLQSTLEQWATNSMVAQQKDRELFLKSYFYLPDKAEEKEPNMDHIMELLLKPIRGSYPTIGSHRDQDHHFRPFYYGHTSQVHPILQAAVNSDPNLIAQQTHQSLAVLAIFRALQDVAAKYGGDEGLKEAESRVREVIKSLPTQMLNKHLDQMFQKWNTSKSGSFQFKPVR
ncbi:hypothetical protein FRC20_003353 [Serendipita sp. 405]|nr:hypothetical protein FRC20_003353 [Serendipita sp. 405]